MSSSSDKVTSVEELPALLRAGVPLIDVRAEVEFAAGHIPHAANLPILNTAERTRVGICYRKHGQSAAIDLGHSLVNGAVKIERIQRWHAQADRSLGAAIYCSRGGMRSEIAQEWLAESGINLPRIGGGYKSLRRACLEVLETEPGRHSWIVVTGRTGSGKTKLLRHLDQKTCSVVDLEQLADHRGSAFGGGVDPQPAQATFENRLAVELLKLTKNGPVLVEDESRLIGRLVIPEEVFSTLTAARLVLLEIPIEDRVSWIIEEYVTKALADLVRRDHPDPTRTLEARYLDCIQRIRERLGNARAQELSVLVQRGFADHERSASLEAHRIWVEQLLTWYYDPLYDRHITRHARRCIYVGGAAEVEHYLVDKLTDI